MKAVTKQKRPFLSKKHRRLRMDFAEAHKDWTVEDWKRVMLRQMSAVCSKLVLLIENR